MPTTSVEKIKGAIRTDFILSAEIIAITLGTVAGAALATQVLVLSGGVELANRPRRRVPRVGERRLPRPLPPAIELQELVLAHVHLSPDVEERIAPVFSAVCNCTPAGPQLKVHVEPGLALRCTNSLVAAAIAGAIA